ncbi:hypothetical protein [Maricaulis maris]|uniref:hypothetical protein n=1 Tax=Maricaulis maris TaxID=74318 RepID=UPI003B8BD991
MSKPSRHIVLAVLSLCVGAGIAQARDHVSEAPVLQACERSGVDASVCACIAREANSRFSHDQLGVLGAAMPEIGRITTDPAVAGQTQSHERLTAEELASLYQRAQAADVVIRQACGVGLSLRDTG